MSLPPIFTDATLRCVMPMCPLRARVGLALNLEGGAVVRVALTQQDVNQLRMLLENQPGAVGEGG